MYNYDDYYEKSKLDELTEEYLNKVSDLFKENIKNNIKEIELQKQTNEKRVSELYDRERFLNKKEEELNKRDREFNTLKDSFIAEWLKKYGFDLSIGQQVYVLTYSTVKQVCPICNDKRKVFAKFNGKDVEIECPDCKGYPKTEKQYN